MIKIPYNIEQPLIDDRPIYHGVAKLRSPSKETMIENFKKMVLKEVEEYLLANLKKQKPKKSFKFGDEIWERVLKVIRESQKSQDDNSNNPELTPFITKDIEIMLSNCLDEQIDQNIFNPNLFGNVNDDDSLVVGRNPRTKEIVLKNRSQSN